jgi:transposase
LELLAAVFKDEATMTMTYFAQPPIDRNQVLLFRRTLDESIPEGTYVRALDELIDTCDFSEFERTYHGSRGQPPIPPKVLAKLWLYGLKLRFRSSRQLEYVTKNNIDFMWIAQGPTPDHVTLSNFRKKFDKQIKGLFQQIVGLAMRMGLVQLDQVTLDGTRVKANNSRSETLTADGIAQELDRLTRELEAGLQECEAVDKAEDTLFGVGVGGLEVPPELATRQARKAELEKALSTVREMDEQRRRTQQINPAKNPAQLPMTDSDSRVLPNKEGGYAPNFTPLAAVDVRSDFIVAVDVIAGVTEHTHLLPIVVQIEADYGQRPKQMLADGHFATGQNIDAFENSGTELISPLPVADAMSANPALRADPTQAVPEAEWPNLPRNPQHKKLDKSCFLYDEEHDLYYCPQGQPMPFIETKSKVQADDQKLKFRVYGCAVCASCPLRKQCVSDQSQIGRTISRDQFTKQRERHAAKMATEPAKAAYKKRLHGGEVPFAHIKQAMGLRQFLLRGLANVRTEWLWTCTAYNVMKLVGYVAKLRAAFAETHVVEAT